MIDPIKHFPGWRVVRSGERLVATDVWVCYRPEELGHSARQAITPETGQEIGQYVGQLANEWNEADYKYWMPYRKDGPSIPRRIVMHTSFSQPLPLP